MNEQQKAKLNSLKTAVCVMEGYDKAAREKVEAMKPEEFLTFVAKLIGAYQPKRSANRSAKSGKFVDKKEAADNPAEVYKDKV